MPQQHSLYSLAVEAAKIFELRYKWVNSSFAGFTASHLVGKRDRDVLERK
jgi:hypothetical protein